MVSFKETSLRQKLQYSFYYAGIMCHPVHRYGNCYKNIPFTNDLVWTNLRSLSGLKNLSWNPGNSSKTLASTYEHKKNLYSYMIFPPLFHTED